MSFAPLTTASILWDRYNKISYIKVERGRATLRACSCVLSWSYEGRDGITENRALPLRTVRTRKDKFFDHGGRCFPQRLLANPDGFLAKPQRPRGKWPDRLASDRATASEVTFDLGFQPLDLNNLQCFHVSLGSFSRILTGRK